jgi:phage gpG-like protein
LKSFTANINEMQKMIARVGIIDDAKNNRDDDELTNAEIGAKHEFGSIVERIPRRSFLKDPFSIKQDETFAKIKNVVTNDIQSKKTAHEIYTNIGLVGESLVVEAFATEGFGTWKPLSQTTIQKKKSDKILFDTGQLSRAITSDVQEK